MTKEELAYTATKGMLSMNIKQTNNFLMVL
jgi:hypothetical protein